MIQDLIDILDKVKERFTDNSDLLWTSYETAKEVRDELNIYMEQLSKGDKSCFVLSPVLVFFTNTFRTEAK